jgi:hypothetical protein
MARAALGTGMVGAFLFFLAILIIVPYVKNIVSPEISGFEDLSCTPGRKPCPEGYFCEQSSCVPILPRYDINGVQPGGY